MSSTTTPLMTLHPGDYSTAQEVVAYLAGAISGLLSLLGSLAVVHYIVRRHATLNAKSSAAAAATNNNNNNSSALQRAPSSTSVMTTVRASNATATPMPLMLELRMVLFQALLQMGTSLLFVFFDFFVPADFDDYALNLGNTASCHLQGWMQQTLFTSSGIYQAALAASYLWTMCHDMTDVEIAKQNYALWIHVAGLGFPVTTATVSVLLNVYNPSSLLGCYYGTSPLGCHESDAHGCDDGGDNAYLYFWFLAGVPLLLCYGFLAYVLVKLHIYVRHLHQLLQEMVLRGGGANASSLEVESAPPSSNSQSPYKSSASSHFQSSSLEMIPAPRSISTTEDTAPASPATEHDEDPSERSVRSVSTRKRANGSADDSLRDGSDPRSAAMRRFVRVEQDGVLTFALYAAAAFVTGFTLFVGVLLDQTASSPPYAVRLLHAILCPLQGFLNFLIFFRPRINHLRRTTQQEQPMTYLEAAYCVVLFRHPNQSIAKVSLHGGGTTAAAAAGGSRFSSVTSASGWTRNDVHEARQMARAMSSRRVLNVSEFSHSMPAPRMSKATKRLQQQEQRQKARSLPPIPSTTPESAMGGTGEPSAAVALGVIAGSVSSIGGMSKSEHTTRTAEQPAKDTLDRNTYHATEREPRASVSSWSKLDASDHLNSAELTAGRLMARDAAAVAASASNRSMSGHDESEAGESFFEGDQASSISPGSRAARRVSADSGLPSSDLDEGASNRSSSSGIPKEIVGDLDSKSFDSRSVGSWSTFSNTDILSGPAERAEQEQQQHVAPNQMPARNESAGLLSSLPVESTPGRLSSVHTSLLALDSVMESEFEDSRADLSASDLHLSNSELPAPMLNKNDHDMTSWSALSSTTDMFSDPNVAALLRASPTRSGTMERTAAASAESLLDSVMERGDDSTACNEDGIVTEVVNIFPTSHRVFPRTAGRGGMSDYGSGRSSGRSSGREVSSWGLLGDSDRISAPTTNPSSEEDAPPPVSGGLTRGQTGTSQDLRGYVIPGDSQRGYLTSDDSLREFTETTDVSTT